MRKSVVLAIFLLLLALFPSAALADEAVALENEDLLLLDKNKIPHGWYTESWYDGEGDYQLEIQKDGQQNLLYISNLIHNDTRLCQSIQVEGGGYYRISCEVKTSGVLDGAGANVSVVDTMATSEAVLGDTDWQVIELTGRTREEDENIIICMRLGGYGMLSAGEAWFRNFTVTKLDQPPESAAMFYMENSYPEDGSELHNVNELHGGAILLSAMFIAAAGAICYKKRILPRQECGEKSISGIYIALGLAFALRCVLSLIFYGHSTDINCFMAWSNALAADGIRPFYTSGMFADYPPGYMYVLWLLGKIAQILNLSYGSAGHVLLIKMPSILADLLAAYAIYRLAEKRLPHGAAFTLLCLVAFNPAMAFISGGWGQIDQLTALLLLAVILLFQQDRLELAGLVFGIAIITKPQSLMAGPLMAVAYFAAIKDKGSKYILRTAMSVAAAVVAILLASLPFKNGQGMLWFLEKLIGTATSYPYASVEAFNLQALLGGNWKPVESGLLFLTYGQWGTIGIILSCVYGAVLYIRSRNNREALCLAMAVTLSGIFTMGQYMHERYVFPVLVLIAAAFVLNCDKRLIRSYILYTCSLMINVLAAFVVVGKPELRGTEYTVITVIGSVLNVAAFIQLAAQGYEILVRREIHPAFRAAAEQKTGLFYEDEERRIPAPDKKDRIYCLVLTGIYAAVALINLGTLQAPENPWLAQMGDRAVIVLEEPAEISELRVFGGLYEGDISITSDNGNHIEYSQTNGDMFRWKAVNTSPFYAGRIELEVTRGRVWLNEIAAFDQDGRQITLTVEQNGEELTDEQDMVPELPSMLNGMYFDELYHGRTAYEHFNGLAPYENSHPPLGKVFIMLGIAVFGMNAFGWRIVGTVFGIAMVPAMFAFGKALFKRRDYALLAAGLMAVDFMHFTQSRIATIDVYGVFFIILMYYYMYKYYCMNFNTDGLKATLRPLALAGVCFGLGAASKWICIYAGGGLAVIFFTSLGKRYVEYRRFRDGDDMKARQAVAGFYRNALYTLLWCCLFYIVVPVGIYLLSYIPYMLSESKYGLKGIWEVQKFMFSYHSGLTATHPYQSQWWQWPLNLRPVWYYVNYYVKEGYSATISAFGNPLVWWTGSICGGLVIAKALSADKKLSGGEYLLLVAMAANYLPWVLVTRCTFAYHFFAMVPFIIFATVYIIRDMERVRPDTAWFKWGYLAMAGALFVMFYPVISGLPVNAEYVKALEWLPGWTFMGY